MQIRLQKFLADCGVASRRGAEGLILQGKITVNGLKVTEMGSKVNAETDIVAICGKTVRPQSGFVYIMLNKPAGYVTTAKDQFNRPTVMDLTKDIKERIFPVGRLDYDTSGLILLTNDGTLANALTHPKNAVKKSYTAKISGEPTDEELSEFKNGVIINTENTKYKKNNAGGGNKEKQYKTAASEIEVIEKHGSYSIVKITITEGKNRQVRKMCEAVHHPVLALKRISIGRLTLADLKEGKYRRLSEKEILYLKSLTKNPCNRE